MKVGDLVLHKDYDGLFGIALKKDYDTSPPVRGTRFYIRWFSTDADNPLCVPLSGLNCWHKKESMEVISESR